MRKISLNREDSMLILNNPDSDPNARAVAAAAVALFEVNEHAFDLSKETRAIVLKLSHLVAAAIYDMDGQ